MSEGLVIVSGGMDSVTLAYQFRADRHKVSMLSFDYGQRHKQEVGYAKLAALRLNCDWHLIDLTSMKLPGSSLTDPGVPVPDGHYAAPSMKATVVPNRNAIMLSIAVGLASARGLDFVATAIHGGDHFIYPDCRPDFISRFNDMISVALEGFVVPFVVAPFLMKTKADIVSIGHAGGVPFSDTWSCYKGGATHCGTCGTCNERKEAFQLAGVADPTLYEV